MEFWKGRNLLTFLFTLLLFIYKIQAGCVTQTPTNFTSDQFYTTPQNVTINACDISNENSCCSVSLSNQIEKYADPWSSSFFQFFSYSATPCKGAIQGITCVLCSAEQSDYLRFHSNIIQYYLCASYCQQVYNSCATSRRMTTTNYISTDYNGDYFSFCYDLFDMISDDNVQLVLDISSDCWDDLPPCTEDSYYSEYTECVNGTRSLIYTMKPEANCNGGTPLPSPVSGLPCAIACPTGQYASSSNRCSACMVGHYSLGSAVREDSWQSWSTLNIPFTTYCTYLDEYKVEHPLTGVDGCGWIIEGFEINSGNLNSSQASYLETSVVFLEDGQMIFDYRVDGEPKYDGLTVYVDRTVVLEKQSTVFDYTLKVVNLTAGYHFVQFVYSKDQSVSQGADKAAMNVVQFSPVVYAADECAACRPGRFQNQTGRSFCYDCPANYYSNTDGSWKCTKCPAGTYSFEGASQCIPQSQCTMDDAYYLYDKCYYNNKNELVQTYYPLWNIPHVCNDNGHSTPPYSNYTLPCASCNPGEYRKGTECTYCADGYASPTGENCEICPAGTQGIKALFLDHFDSWDQGLSTNCSYYCGSPGWELHDDYIDSGSGHGRYVNSNLYLEATLPVNGFIYFSFQLNCSQSCELEFFSSNGTAANYRGGPNITLTSTTARFAVNAGDNHFRWVFTKNDPDGTGRLDYARIDSIIIANVVDGGATNCTACKDGSFTSQPGQSVCSTCPPGTYSSSGASSCTPCDSNHFNPSSGASECLPCGESTQSNEDHTDCLVTCQYTYDNQQYDLSPMARTDDEMYGPIYDSKNQVYYLNLCNREHNNHTCIDLQGNPIDTFACQVTTVGFGVDLGDVFGFLPLRYSVYYPDGGVTVHLTNGEACKNTTSGQSFPRQTYIDVVCDATAGIGSPIPYDTDDNIVETSKCVYEFTWRSLYGCHECTSDDFTYIISDCNTEGNRFIQYEWAKNPKTCHGGVSLPQTIEISCSNSLGIYCPPGSYLDLSVLSPVCTKVEAGFYSIGGGIEVIDWTQLPDSFSIVGWETSDNGRSITSGGGDTYLLYLHEFVEVGEIIITYRIFGYSATSGFSVYVDDTLALGLIQTTNGVFNTQSIPIYNIAHHFIRFEFIGGELKTNYGGGIGIEIEEIKIIGIYHTAEYQIPCLSGTYSEEGASECIVCPANTYSHSGSGECVPCGHGYYSFAGSNYCTKKAACNLSDYQKIYTECEFGVRYEVYEPLQPFICDNSTFKTPNVTTVPCDTFDCQPGEYRKSSLQCDICNLGYYYDESSNRCEISEKGYAAILQTGYYYQPEAALPIGFTTGCVGDCADPNIGWRSRSTYLDSGSNTYREVDVYLELTTTLLSEGSIAFQVEVTGDEVNGLYVFVNGKQTPIPFHPSSPTSLTISLNAGENTIRWVYHQEMATDGVITLHNILITGTGGATSEVECPSGTFSNETGLSSCYSCAPGFFSSSAASTECSPCSSDSFAEYSSSSSCKVCGDETYSNANHTDCETSCIYDITTPYGSRKVDLSPLGDMSGPFSLTTTTDKLWLNVCAKKSSPVICVDSSTGASINTYSCEIDSTGRGYDSGHLLSVAFGEKQSVIMSYSEGGVNNDCPSPITTSILFTCNADNDTSLPFELEGSSPCGLRLQWNISFACPVCTEDDYELKTSDCVDGKQTIAYVRSRDCYGPAIKDADDGVECSNSLGVFWVILISSCTVGGILLVVIGFILYWNRTLQKKYFALVQKESGNYEMSDLPDTLLDEDDDDNSSIN